MAHIEMTPDDLAAHKPYGHDLRHDLITTDGLRIPAWTTITWVGVNQGLYVSRWNAQTQIVLLRVSAPWTKPAWMQEGTIHTVHGYRLLIAADDLDDQDCECTPDDRQCYNRQVQRGEREPMENRNPRWLKRNEV